MRDLILTLIIWIICFTAIVVGASLTYKWYRQLGTDVHISFQDVSGLVPNQSKIMYHGVDIGTINDIDIDFKTGKPKITARITKSATKILGKDSKFWIVRPEVSLGSIHNLSTISTGDYIEVHPEPGKFVHDFVGLDEAPSEHKYSSGLRLVLNATAATGLEVGSAVLYNDLEIGEVGGMGLAHDKKNVLITIYIDKPYVDVIRKNSYFANVSGFHADLHIFGGSQITLNSLRTLVRGGITLITPNLKGPPAKNGDTFKMLTREQYAELNEKC